jgi:hypothetical protein
MSLPARTFTPLGERSEPGLAGRWVDAASSWCVGRNWVVRVPLVLWLAWIGVRQFGDAEYSSLLGALNLGVHEAGHLVFRAFGETLCVAGGTILQLAAPVAAIVMFLRQPDWFAAAFGLGWLSTNLHGVGTYMSDAEEMRLPLVTVGSGENVGHDWRFLFERFDVLHRCEAIGAATHGLAHVTMFASIAACSWLLWKMAASRGR